MSNRITIHGAGPAGSCAALAALKTGAPGVDLYEPAKLPRHKVCGEFLSGGLEPVLRSLGAWDTFTAARPAAITHLELHLGRRCFRSRLPVASTGLSRFALDKLLLDCAVAQGASLHRELGPSEPRPLVTAHGRYAVAPAAAKGTRLFGFKAHYRGPVHHAVELFFWNDCYVGLNAIEDGLTNVCGLGPEHRLRAVAFAIDDLLGQSPALRERLQPLERTMNWLTCGPLLFRNRLNDALEPGVYPAGDALSFVDPFTGSGMFTAAVTGRLAGQAAVQRLSPADYLAQCRRTIAEPFRYSSFLRWTAAQPWAGLAATVVPGPLLFRLTRPHTM